MLPPAVQAERVSPSPTRPPPRHKCFVPTSSRPHPQADARELGPEFWAEHCPGGFDVVLSDM